MNDRTGDIIRRSRDFELHFAKGDAGALVASYYVSDDHSPTAWLPDGTLIRGQAQLIGMFEEQFAAAKAIKLQPVEMVQSPGMATELGHAQLTMHDGAVTHGRYAVTWIDTADGWRVQSDVIISA